MGQQGSHDSSAVSVVQGKLRHHAEIFRRIAKLTYKEFVDSVSDLNRVTSSFTDQRGKQLQFAVKSGSDETVLWKATVRVQCKKVTRFHGGTPDIRSWWSSGTPANKINPRTNVVLSTRDLNLRQYILVYKEITDQVHNLPSTLPHRGTLDICASVILEEAEHKSLEMEEECCICMQNEAKTIMPCTHKFCENCCTSWTDTHKTCPICREKVSSSGETWLLTDAPDETEYASEMKEVLVGIADRQNYRGEPT